MKYPYEVLIRLNRDGIVGAHVVFAADMENPLTGEVQTAIGNAEPLAVADGQAGLSLAAVLGDAAASALLERETALAAKEQALRDKQVLQAELDVLRQQLAQLQAQQHIVE